MVYFPDSVFNLIISFTDNRIETNQMINLSKCVAIINHLKIIADYLPLEVKNFLVIIHIIIIIVIGGWYKKESLIHTL